MKCSTCGAELQAGATFCVNCGTRAPTPPPSVGNYTTQLQEPDVPQMRLPPTSGTVVPTGQWGTYSPASTTSELAVASLVCGICGIVQILPIVGPVAAVVTGHLARREIRASGGSKTGDGLALAGLIMGYITLVLYLLACVLGVVFFAALANYAGRLN